MKTRLTLLFVLVIHCIVTFGQRTTIDLTFTAVDSAAYVQLDSIKVMNRKQGGETMIYYPDTTVSLEITTGDLLLYIGYATFSSLGVQEISNDEKQFQLFQNYPNPVYDQSIISMWVPDAGTVNVLVIDVQGRVILANDWRLDRGNHSFRFIPGEGNLFILTARWNGISQSIKIIAAEPNNGQKCNLSYYGSSNGESDLKAYSQASNDTIQESGIPDIPEENQAYTFQFATNIPCPGTPTVEYEGQVYNTIQVFSQCWLKENLNVGTMIPKEQEMADNGVLEKYCYNNEPDSCTKYGGHYQWQEMMQYTHQQGAQGICPPGWHLPTDEEWKVLEGAVDSQYGIGDNTWDDWHFRGFDAGTNLKTTSGWHMNGNGTDLFGFSGLPGGFRYGDGTFSYVCYLIYWWSSTERFSSSEVFLRYLIYDRPDVSRGSYDYYDKNYGFTVRCLRDY